MNNQAATTPPDSTQPVQGRSLVQWVVLGVVSVLLAIVIRTVAVGIYVIPTSSMEPTLMAGDVVLVSKLRYGLGLPPVVPFTDVVLTNPIRWWWNHPQRGDIVVFRFAYHSQYPSEPEYFVKRVVGLPGDTLWIVGDSVLTHRPSRRWRASQDQPYTGAVIVPSAGMTISLSTANINYWRPFIEREGNTVDVFQRAVRINGYVRTEYTFERNFYYVLGDNRARSFDSRWWGFVSEVDVIGSPVLVLWSKSPVRGIVRWERIGRVPR